MQRYLVFARTEYDESLEHRGEVEAGGDGAASKAALEEYGDDWLEMWLVPESCVYWAERGGRTEEAGV